MNSGDLERHLLLHLRRLRAAPFLFVGAGLSRRYLGLPNWEGLLREVTSALPRAFEYYRSTAGGQLPQTASLLAPDFHDLWWLDERYSDQRVRHSSEARDVRSALKVAVATLISTKADLTSVNAPATQDPALQEEVTLLREGVIDGVITTNFDPLVRDLFPEFPVYVGQDQLLFSDAQGVGESYYIHGTAEDPESLVLTAEDYDLFDQRNPYLAAKLLTVFVEHPVVFLGYSISDPNIQKILREITRCLTGSNIGDLADRLLFVEWSPGLAEPEMAPSNVVFDGVPLPILRVAVSDYRPVYRALARIERPFPARLLRQLREHVYNLVNEPGDNRESVFVQDLDARDPSGLRVVFGVGRFDANSVAELGLRAVRRDDLAHDVLGTATRPIPADGVLTEALPAIVKNTPYVPVWKYLREAGRLAPEGAVNTNEIEPAVAALLTRRREQLQPGDYLVRRRLRDLPEARTPADLEAVGIRALLDYVALLDPADYGAEELRLALVRAHAELPRNHGTAFHKAVCLYDLLRFGPTEAL